MKKIICILFVAAAVCSNMSAQVFFKSEMQQFIENVTCKGLLVAQQQYQLEDTVSLKRFGVNNTDVFGSAVSFCVLTREGYVVPSNSLRPWTSDQKFEKYKDSQYRPVLSKTAVKSVKDSAFVGAGLACPVSQRELPGDLLAVTDTLFHGHGFVVDTTVGEKEGWLVWLKSEGDDLAAGSLSTTAYMTEITVEKDKNLYEIPQPMMAQDFVCGIYVVPQYTEIGTVEFALVGVAVKVDDKWQIVRIADDSAPASDEAPKEGDHGDAPFELSEV